MAQDEVSDDYEEYKFYSSKVNERQDTACPPRNEKVTRTVPWGEESDSLRAGNRRSNGEADV